MTRIVYTLKKKKDTEELHLFEAVPSPDSKCTPKPTSVCKEMNSSESSGNVFACQNEEASRIECAKIGRQVW